MAVEDLAQLSWIGAAFSAGFLAATIAAAVFLIRESHRASAINPPDDQPTGLTNP